MGVGLFRAYRGLNANRINSSLPKALQDKLRKIFNSAKNLVLISASTNRSVGNISLEILLSLVDDVS